MKSITWPLILSVALTIATAAPVASQDEQPPLQAVIAQHWSEFLGHTVGGPAVDHARYQVIEFGDFECPQCCKIRPTIDRLVSPSGDATKAHDAGAKVSLYFIPRPFPQLRHHGHSIEAAEAAISAASM